jgi:hypothetical protein
VVEVSRDLPAQKTVTEYLRSCKNLGAAGNFQAPLKKAKVVVGPRGLVAAVSSSAKPELASYVFKKVHWL